MTDTNEIRALKASFRGVADAAAALLAIQGKVEALADDGDIGAVDLEELQRLTSANSVAAAALRGLVGTMQARRSANAAS
jgi:hypothetical protein